MILVVEAGIFPLMCGWWIDICSFVSFRIRLSVCVGFTISLSLSLSLLQTLFGSTIKNRQESLDRATGTVTNNSFQLHVYKQHVHVIVN